MALTACLQSIAVAWHITVYVYVVIVSSIFSTMMVKKNLKIRLLVLTEFTNVTDG